MPIILIIIGIILVVVSDKLQPDPLRKTKMNTYLSSLGGIVWLAGVIWSFFSYSLLHAILILVASFVAAAIVGVKR